MSSVQVIEAIHHLKPDEKITVLDALWHDVAEDLTKSEIPESHRIELKKRLEKISSDQETFDTWANVKNRILAAK